jgi:ribonuclease VapC
MVIDTSAILACMFDEPERVRFIAAIEAASTRLMSVIGVVEASFVILSRRGEAGLVDLTTFIDRAAIERITVDPMQAEAAVDAFRRFGRGRHPAGLNIGDCFAYALAKTTGEPLLFKGSDFARTDISAALPR